VEKSHGGGRDFLSNDYFHFVYGFRND